MMKTEEDDVMSNHIVSVRARVGGSESGTGQLHIVYPQHVLYELFKSRASVGANVGFYKWEIITAVIVGGNLSACSDTGFSCLSKAG